MGAGSFFSGLVGGFGKSHLEAKRHNEDLEREKTERKLGYLKALASNPEYMRNPAAAHDILEMMNQTLNPGKPGGKGKAGKGMGVLQNMAGALFSTKPSNPSPDTNMSSMTPALADAPQQNQAADIKQGAEQDAARRQSQEQDYAAKDKWIDSQPWTDTEKSYAKAQVRGIKPAEIEPGSKHARKNVWVMGKSGSPEMASWDAYTDTYYKPGTSERLENVKPTAAPEKNILRNTMMSQIEQALKGLSNPDPRTRMSAKMALTDLQNRMMAGSYGNAAKAQGIEINRVLSGVSPSTPIPPEKISEMFKNLSGIVNKIEVEPGEGTAPESATAPAPTPSSAPTTAKPAAKPVAVQTPAPTAPAANKPLPELASRRWRQMLGLDKEPTGNAANVGQQAGMEQLKKATGMSDEQLAAVQVERRAVKKALDMSVERAGLFDRLNQTIKQHSILMTQAFRNVTKTKVPWANLKLNELRDHFVDDPRLQAFETSLLAVQREYVQIIAGAVQSRAQPHQGAMVEAQKLINPGMTVGRMYALVTQIQKEAQAEQVAYHDQQRDLLKSYSAPPTEKAVPYGEFIPNLPDNVVSRVKEGGPGVQTIYDPEGNAVNVVYRDGKVWRLE